MNGKNGRNKNHSKGFIIVWLAYVVICIASSLVLFFTLSSEKVSQIMPRASFDLEKIIEPNQNIKVRFNQPVRREGVEESFKITPNLEGNIVWDNDNTGFEYVTDRLMDSGQKYIVAFLGENKYWIPLKAIQEFSVYEEPIIEKISPFKDQGIKVDEKIFIKFNKKIYNYGVETEINPKIVYKTSVSQDKSEFVLVPEEELESDQSYNVKVYLYYNSLKKGSEKKIIKDFTFSTLAPLNFVSVYPKNNIRDVVLKQKFTLSFGKPVDLESFRESLNIAPEALYKIKSSTNGKTLAIYPESLSQDTDYTLAIRKGLKAQDGSYLEKEEIVNFKTGNAGGVIHDERRATDDPFIKDGKYVDINLSQQLLGIYNDGMVLGTYRISSGKSGMRTPTGRFSVFKKTRKHWSRKYKLWMPYSMQFTGAGHFIHELPEWPNGYKEGTNHLGIPVSHGCVRLGVGPAETIFNFSDIGTPIYIHY